MTKHLTHEQFSKQFLDDFLKSCIMDQNACTRVLGQIFGSHRKEIAEHLESCLEYLDQEIENGYGGSTHDLVGYTFHKGFRQIDPIDAPLLNGIVWTCIGSSDLFWDTMHKVSEFHDKGSRKVSKPLDTV